MTDTKHATGDVELKRSLSLPLITFYGLGTLARRLWQAGYAASIKRVDAGNRTFYRLHVDRFDSELEARGFASRIKGRFGVTSPWVTHTTVESRPDQ